VMREILNPPRGLNDIVGVEAEIYEYLFDEFRRVARLHGFKPVIPPTIEYSKLFEAKSGVEIKKSMYVFHDKAGRVLALRPEVTASVIRIYLRLMRGEVKPIRLYYISQCFRYEEPQYGRYREFWQGGLEIIGDPGINSDLSVAYTASTFLENIGVKHYYIVSNVYLHRLILSRAGVSIEKQDEILHYIDKDMVDKAFETLSSNTSSEYVEAFRKLVETPIDKLDDFIEEYRGLIGDQIDKFREEVDKTRLFIDTLQSLGFKAVYNPRLVRGLAYYTGLIYEYKVETGGFKLSIGGGGRYDNLTRVYSNISEYSTGLALGLDRIALILKGSRSIRLIDNSRQVLIISLENTPLNYSYRVLSLLTSNNIGGWIYRTSRVDKGLSIASKHGYRFALIIGSREYSGNTVSLKDLVSGEQFTVELNNLVDRLKPLLQPPR